MTTIKLDSITFRLKEQHDFSWLKNTAKRFGVLMKLVPVVLALEWKMQIKSTFVKLPE